MRRDDVRRHVGKTDVSLTSVRRDYVAVTSIRCHVGTKCPFSTVGIISAQVTVEMPQHGAGLRRSGDFPDELIIELMVHLESVRLLLHRNDHIGHHVPSTVERNGHILHHDLNDEQVCNTHLKLGQKSINVAATSCRQKTSKCILMHLRIL